MYKKKLSANLLTISFNETKGESLLKFTLHKR